MQSTGGGPEKAPDDGSQRAATTFKIRQDSLSKRKAEALVTTKRKMLVLGRHVRLTIHGVQIGGMAWYEPSPFPSEYENTFIYGPSGSGKTYTAYGLASQSFFFENRTWLIIDTKLSYIGAWRANIAFAEDLAEFGLYPRGIPSTQIDIIAPEYYMQYVSPDEIRRTRVTASYRIPLAMCRLAIMFELTKLKKGAGYAATFEVLFQNLLKETNYKPTLDQFKKMTEDMMQDDRFPSNLIWVFNMMLDRIDRIAKFTIDDQHQWSPVGEALFRAAREGRPRWIVFTLAHAQSPTDVANLAMLTAVLDEVKAFAKKAKVNGFNIPLGVFIDELHTFVNDPQSTSVKAVHDLMHAWGRSSKIWRIYATQKQDQLPKTFRDSVENLTNAGTYQNIVSCQQVPEPGYGKFLDRLHGRSDDGPVSDSPRFYPSVKFCPPMIEVESDYVDEDDWRRAMIEKYSGVKRKPKPISNEPWEDIVANLASANAKMSDIVRGDHPRAGGTILRGSPASLSEIKGMWRDVADRLRSTAQRTRPTRPRADPARR